jgi:hypothetical protein
MRRLIVLLFIALTLPLVSYASNVGDEAPDFEVKTLDGEVVSYSEDYKGKKVIYLMLWATW